MNKTEEYMFGTGSNKIVEDDDLYEDEKKHLDKGKIIIIGTLVLLAFLLVTSVVGLVNTVRYKNQIKQKDAEIVEIQNKLKSADQQIIDLNNQITILKTDENTNTDVVNSPTTETTSKTTMTALAGLKVRKEPSLEADWTETELNIKGINYSDGVVLMDEGTEFTVLEVKKVGDNTWAKIGKDAWVCSNYEGESLAE